MNTYVLVHGAWLGAWSWDVRKAVYVALALIAAAFAIALTAPASLHFGLKGASGSTSNATSGRTKLIEGGLELFAQRPLQGYGSGSFQKEFERHRSASNGKPLGQHPWHGVHGR